MKKTFFLIIVLLISISSIYSQVELVPISHKVYPFLKRMELKGVIENYNSSNLPFSRKDVAIFLKEIQEKQSNLDSSEKKVFKDLLIEFHFDLEKNLEGSYSFFKKPSLGEIFNDDNYKYLYAYADSNASLFLDGMGSLSYRDFNAESYPKTNIGLGEIGIRLRGTLYDNFGYYLRMSNGQQINGDGYARVVAASYDSKLHSTLKFLGEKYYDSFEGYMRFEASNRAIALTFGREKFQMGTGSIDKLFLSGNTAPFDFGRIDVKYKSLHYSFFYGNLKGDSLGVALTSKNIIAHRLDINFSENFRLGLYESIIAANRPISFTYMNPLSFLTSADFTAEPKNQSNALMGIDMEIKPINDIAFQLSLLIDDLNFKTLYANDASSDDNKFGYQAGIMFVDPFKIPDITATVEYTRIDPFVYSHRTNESTYADWGISLGHALPPNSDEIAILLNYYLSGRTFINFKYQHQRSGTGIILDSKGNLIRNYGGDLNRGDGDGTYRNEFLMGNRIDRDMFTFALRLEPVRQYFIDLTYSLQNINMKYIDKKYVDSYFYVTVSTDF
ncbi:MAG: capsule assembly Wzi family protein [Bacteroidota bacterium]